MPRTVYLLTKTGTGDREKTFFNRAGVAFDANRDGSVNFKLDLFPALTFQIRDNKSDAAEPEYDRGREYNQEAGNGRRR